MITIIDYGAGNLFSVQNALNYLGLENRVSSDPAEIRSADGLILPGVGAFPDAMSMLNASGLTGFIREEARKKPFLGILKRDMSLRKRPVWDYCPGQSRKSRRPIKSPTWAGTA